MAAAMALGGFTGPEADTLGYAIRKKKSSVLRAQKEKFVSQAAERGVDAAGHRRGLQGVRAVRALRLQQGPRHLLRADRVPDRLPQGELHGRVHDRGPDRVPRQRGEGRRGDRRVPADGHRGPAAGRPSQRARVHGRGRRDPVRAAGGQERRRGRDRVDHRRARRGRAVQVAGRLLHPHRPSPREPQGARVARQGRRAECRSAIRRRSSLGLDDALATGQAAQRDRISGQTSLFEMGGEDAPVLERPLPVTPEAPVRERLRWEKELLGLYLSGHPMGEVANAIGVYVTAYSGELRDDDSLDGQRVVLGGIVTGVRVVITKARSTMVDRDARGPAGHAARSSCSRGRTRRRPEMWREGRILLVAGKVDHRGGGEGASLLADAVVGLGGGRRSRAGGVPARGRVGGAGASAARLEREREWERDRPGVWRRSGRPGRPDGAAHRCARRAGPAGAERLAAARVGGDARRR